MSSKKGPMVPLQPDVSLALSAAGSSPFYGKLRHNYGTHCTPDHQKRDRYLRRNKAMLEVVLLNRTCDWRSFSLIVEEILTYLDLKNLLQHENFEVGKHLSMGLNL